MITYQDYEKEGLNNIETFINKAIECHKASTMYKIANEAELYDRQLNVAIMKAQKFLYKFSGETIPDRFAANHKVVSNFFNRFITLQNQYLLGNGITFLGKEVKASEDVPNAYKKLIWDELPTETKEGKYHFEWFVKVDTGATEKLGKNFNTKLKNTTRSAMVGALAFGFWNYDHLEHFSFTEFVPLFDEFSGELRAGVRFWQIDKEKPLMATLYTEGGITSYIKKK